MKKLYIIGLGPGAGRDLTGRAAAALEASDVIVGYTVYIDLIRERFGHKELRSTPMRKETERPEAIAAGTAKLAGVEKERIVALAQELLDDPAAYEAMAKAVNPYGDGNACKRIADAIGWYFGLYENKPESFQ